MLDRWTMPLNPAAAEMAGPGAGDGRRAAGPGDRRGLRGRDAGATVAGHGGLRRGARGDSAQPAGDGLDGTLARLTDHDSDAGGFLDIGLDFVFYAAVVLGFALADPGANALAASLLLFAFIGTGTSFLAFAIMAARHALDRPRFPRKAFYYLNGLTEGTETVLALVSFCLWPAHFPLLAGLFAVACLITTATRLAGGYLTLKAMPASE